THASERNRATPPTLRCRPVATIAMAHGLFSDSSFDVAQADALRALGHEVVAVDLLGHGRADKPISPGAYTFVRLADDIAAAADALLDGPADLEAIAQPTLIVALPGDLLHPVEVAEAYWRHIPTSRLIAETPGDELLWDRPDDLAMQVDRFLREVLH